MQSKLITFRLPPALHAAAAEAADRAGLSLAMYARALIEQDTGVLADPKPGTTGLTEEERRAIGRNAARKRWS